MNNFQLGPPSSSLSTTLFQFKPHVFQVRAQLQLVGQITAYWLIHICFIWEDAGYNNNTLVL